MSASSAAVKTSSHSAAREDEHNSDGVKCMARHRTSRLTPDLFPFLSIIVCVIGVIAFLISILTLVGSQQGENLAEYESLRAAIAERKTAAGRPVVCA